MYGQVFEQAAPPLKAGINEFDKVKSLELVNLDLANYTGPVIDLELEKNDSIIYSERIFPVNPQYIRPRERDGKMESMEDATKRAYGEFNSRVKHIFTNWLTEEEFNAVTATDFADYAKQLIAKLPDDYNSKFILTYNNKGYLEMPKYMWITGAFFSVDGAKELVVGSKVKLVNPKAASDGAENTPKAVEW